MISISQQIVGTAAATGHERAKETLWFIGAADRAGFGFDHLVHMSWEQPSAQVQLSQIMLPGPLMICAARFTDACFRKFGAITDVIAYELDGAASSDFPYVKAFLSRTGVEEPFFNGGMMRLAENSAADEITDGLTEFLEALQRSGAMSESGVQTV